MSLFDDASLVLIPDGAKDSKLYSVKPTDGGGDFTFSRGSNLATTRVNENGLIEKGRENLLLYSEAFDGSLSNTAISGTAVVTDNDAISPDGNLTAATLSGATDTNFGGNNGFKLFSASPNTLYTCSIYVRSDNTTNFQVAMRDDNSGNFTRETYTVTTEWQRVTVQRQKNSSSGTIRLYYGGTTADVEIWGAQAEVGSVATEYIKSTSTTGKAGVLEDLPRIDYSEGGCPSLLLEPQRTNLVTYSEDFSNSDWLKVGVGSGVAPIVTSDQGIAPDGTMSADRVQLDVSASSGDGSILRQLFSALSTTGKITFYAKSNTGSDQYVLYHDGTPEGEATITTEWQRFEFESDGTGRTYFGIELRNGTSTQNTADILLWGFQVEDVDSYPTSYIPTTSAAVTRNADSCELTGVADLIGDSEGTLYFEGSVFDTTEANTVRLSDGTTANRVEFNFLSSGQFRLRVNVGGSIQVSTSAGTTTLNQTYKIAITYANNDFAVWVDGIKLIADASGVTFADGILTKIAFEGPSFYGNVKQLTVFPTALTDTQLENLTS